MVRTTEDSLSFLDAGVFCLWWWCRVHVALILSAEHCSAWWFVTLAERRVGGCDLRWHMKFYVLCQARGHQGR